MGGYDGIWEIRWDTAGYSVKHSGIPSGIQQDTAEFGGYSGIQRDAAGYSGM